jgi:hypothetical protein
MVKIVGGLPAAAGFLFPRVVCEAACHLADFVDCEQSQINLKKTVNRSQRQAGLASGSLASWQPHQR